MPTDIYQLTPYQSEVLKAMAVGENPAMVLPELSQNDPDEVIKRVSSNRAELDDLITLGLVKDLTPEFLEAIMAERVKNGRGYEVFGPTEIGKIMFAPQEKKGKGKEKIVVN